MPSQAPPKASVTPVSGPAKAHDASPPDRQMSRLVLELVRPYRGWLAIVFVAMLVDIAMSLAAPWPLKLVLDDALGNHRLPAWLAWAHDYGIGRHTLGVALFAGLATLFIAIGVTPFLLMFVMRFKKAVKEVTRVVRVRQSEVVAVVQEGLGSVRAVKAFGRQDLEVAHMEAASHATVEAALKARQVKSLLSPVVSVVVAICTAVVLWKGTSLIVAGTMTAGALTVYLATLTKFFKPVKDLASMTSAIAQTTVALERIQKILSADDIIHERADATEPGRVKGAIVFDHVAFGYGDDAPVLRDVSFTIAPGQVVGIVGPTGSGKSTVLSLIPRFYDPNAGRVLNAAGRRQARDRGFDQPGARQLRRAPRTRNRDRQSPRIEAARGNRDARLGALPSARPIRRGAAEGPEEARGPESRQARARGGERQEREGEGLSRGSSLAPPEAAMPPEASCR